MKYFYFILVGARHGAPPYFLMDEKNDPARFDSVEKATAIAEGSFSVKGGFGYLIIEEDGAGKLFGVER